MSVSKFVNFEVLPPGKKYRIKEQNKGRNTGELTYFDRLSGSGTTFDKWHDPQGSWACHLWRFYCIEAAGN